MKGKITRIMGGVLALVMVFTLGAAFMPVNTPGGPAAAEAGDLTWSTIGAPSLTNNVLVTNNQDLGPVAISPNFATDKTVWASVVDVTTPATPVVYKSTDGGFTWSATTTTLGLAGDYVVDLKASPMYATDSTLFVVVQTPAGGAASGKVYRSVNGSSSFGQLGVVTLAGAEIITGFDVSPNYDGTGILAVSVASQASGTAATLANALQLWGSNSVLSWTSVAPLVAVDAAAVKFSPNYSMDSTLLVVASLANTAPQLRAVVGGVWDSGITATNVGAAGCVTDFGNVAVLATDILAASIALPSDYNGQISTTRRAYVSIVTEAGAGATTGNIYRITNITAGTAINTAAAVQLYPIDFNGDFSGGTLIGGLFGAGAGGGTQADVYRTTNPTDSVVNWYGVTGAVNQPTGSTTAIWADNTTAYVAMSPSYATDKTVVVGTRGSDSAFGISLDGAVSFNERGLIENAGVAVAVVTDIGLSPVYGTDKTMFLVTSNDNGVSANDTNVWLSADGGAKWERCFTANFFAPGTGVIAFSAGFAGDKVVYVGDTGATAIYYTANAGKTWSARNVAAGLGVTIATVAAPDASTVYVGDLAGVGNVAKSTNSGWTWPSSLMKNSGATAPVVSLKAKDSSILVGGSQGTVRRSDDGGATWSKVSGTLTAAAVYVDFDGTTVYAVETGTGNVYRSIAGAAWAEIGATTTGANAVESILATDGTFYYAEGAGQDVMRSINPDAALPAPNATFANVPGLPAANLAFMDISSSSGSNTIAIVNVTPAIRIYTDTLSKGATGPTLSSPANGTTLTRAQTTRLSIAAAIANVTTYQVQWSTDSGFASNVTSTPGDIVAPSLQSTTAYALTEGVTIYWRVRADAPLIGPWSATWTVVTQVTTAVQAPAPIYPGGLAGSTVDVPVKPVFNWGAFKYADGYEFQLSKDSAMSSLLVDMSGANALGNITSYAVTAALDYSTTYYWRVRAIKTGAAWSDWSATTGFTTLATPVEPTPPVIIEPTPAPVTPSTPGYIWAIIGIGAVLVIVVIVLIVRTRRTI